MRMLFFVCQYKHEGRIVLELVDTETELTADDQLLMQYRMTSYVQQFVDPDQSSCDSDLTRPVFLQR